MSSPATRASDRSTFETSSGRPEYSRETCASASSAGITAEPWPAAVPPVELAAERLPEPAARLRDLVGRGARRHLEPDVEPGAVGEQAEQMVEDRDAGRDLRPAGALDVDARLEAPPVFLRRSHAADPSGQASTRSIRAPSARSRSSIRS